MRISDWSSDVCSSDLHPRRKAPQRLVKGDLEGKGPFAMPEIDQHRDRPPIQVHAQEMQPPVLESRRAGRPEESRILVLARSEEHTSELQSLMRISYAVFCLKKKQHKHKPNILHRTMTSPS